VSWLGRSRKEPDERAWEWVQHIGCDSWILPVDEASPLEHAERRNAHLEDTPAEHDDALARWTSYLQEHDAEVVTEGAVLLHRRDGNTTSRIDEVDEDDQDQADLQIRRAFARRAALGGDDLLGAARAPADGLRVDAGSKRARVRLEGGTRPLVDVSVAAAKLLRKLAGGPLRGLKPSAKAVAACRELLELGALEL